MEWQPVETAPRDGTWVLVAYTSPYDSGVWFARCSKSSVFPAWEGDDFIATDRTCDAKEPADQARVTHWMPLPKPPP